MSYLESVADDDLEQSVMVRSRSGDIGVLVLFVLYCFGSNVFIDNSNGNSRKSFDFECQHCPYFSAKLYQVFMYFQEMAKENTYFGKLTKDENFMSIFASLGNTYQLSSQTKKALERFVCCLYGFKKLNSVNEVQRMYVLAETCEQLQ